MKLHQAVIAEENVGLRAGLVPFLADARCLFAIPSGGEPIPEIAKGQVEGNEDTKQAAIREAQEELGLRRSNMATQPFLGWSGKLSGVDASYHMDVYAVLVKDENAFNEPDEETDSTLWLTRSEFTAKGRKAHVQIMEKIFEKIEVYLKNK